MIHVIAPKGTPAGTETIEITLKLFAMLERWLPEGTRRNEARVAVPVGTTPADIVTALDLPAALCAIVLVDGRFVDHETRATRPLAPGEVLSIWPPIAGG